VPPKPGIYAQNSSTSFSKLPNRPKIPATVSSVAEAHVL
jgi:hypothetical protein